MSGVWDEWREAIEADEDAHEWERDQEAFDKRSRHWPATPHEWFSRFDFPAGRSLSAVDSQSVRGSGPLHLADRRVSGPETSNNKEAA